MHPEQTFLPKCMVTTKLQQEQQLSTITTALQANTIELEPSYDKVKTAFHNGLTESCLRTLRTTEELVKAGRIQRDMLMSMFNDTIRALMRATPGATTANVPPPNIAFNENAFREQSLKGIWHCAIRVDGLLKKFNLAAETCGWLGDDRQLIR